MSGEGVAGLAGLLILLAIVPGPSDLLVAGCAARRGYWAAWSMVGGIVVADLLLLAVTLLGLSVVAATADSVSRWIDAAAAFLLIGFGASMLRAKGCRKSCDASAVRVRGGSFATGFAITFLDPKALAFYFGALPALFELERFGWMEAGLLLGIVTAVICLTKGFCAWLAARGMRLLPRPAYQRAAYCVFGCILVAIGVGLFFS